MPNIENQKVSSGIYGLDEILNGGFPQFCLYAIQGEPGSGKTTFALQFLMEGVKKKQKVLYVTFSETKKELERVALSHNWNLKGIEIMDLTSLENIINPSEQNSLFHPADMELNQVTDIIMKKIDEQKPERIVFDSISEMRLLAETPLRYRRQILSLKHALSQKDATVLFLDDLTHSKQDLQIHSIAHGVVNLMKLDNDYGGERRRLRVMKLRGVNFIGGYHDFEIIPGGMNVYPRITAATYSDKVIPGQLKSGSVELDTLMGGGLDYGTSSLFIGPAGTAKSSLCLKYALAAAKQNKKVLFFTFDETIKNMHKRSQLIGMDIEKYVDSGLLKIQKVDPAELSPGAFAGIIQKSVKEEDYSVVIIDSLNGYIQAMPQEQFLVLQLHELLAFLNNNGVVTLMTLAQQGLINNMSSPVDLTYLADTVVLTRYFEAYGAVKKAISVIKKRTGEHESTIREFLISQKGIEVGEILHEFEGVLTGTPRYHGRSDKMIEEKK